MTTGHTGDAANQRQRLARIDLSGLKKVKPRDLAIRFAFGAAVAVVAGIASLTLGSAAAGPLLAFPAILPATLTLMEKEDGESKTIHDLQGSVLGAVGMCAFAVVAWSMLGRLPLVVALLLALAAWAVTSGGLYVIWAFYLRRRGVKL